MYPPPTKPRGPYIGRELSGEKPMTEMIERLDQIRRSEDAGSQQSIMELMLLKMVQQYESQPVQQGRSQILRSLFLDCQKTYY